MYGIFTYIWLIFMVNVGEFTIHGSYGLWGFFRGSTGRYHQFVHFSRPQRHPAMPRPDDCRSLLQPLQLPAETKQHIFGRVGFMNSRKSMGNLMVVSTPSEKYESKWESSPNRVPIWQFFVNFLGWLSDQF